MSDYYKILGVNRNASDSEIEQAYRKLARKYHPDLNPDDKSAKEKFQQVQKAYDILHNPSTREQYDQFGSSFESMGGNPGGGQGWPPHGGGGGVEFDFNELFGERYGEGRPSGFGGGFADIFRQFTQGSGPTPSRHGANIRHEIKVPFDVAVTGGEANLRVQRARGKTENISVKIPPGIISGKKIRLRGQGESSRGRGQSGDILITVQVIPHPYFQIRGDHLEVRVPVTLAEAALGATVDVPSPHGTISLKIPPGTSSGRKLRVKGHGVQRQGKTPGDLYAEVTIVLPDTIDDDSRELIKQFNQRHQLNPRKDLKW